ncbi:hypothetical protein COO91_10611 (plasmid) [Nostoc flagelliforme CCNUN1]|uniref:Uncharacterized protein n=1 Tax=Nostoc flagelliforme CCNUN1 TaxID=2038116 RepID=A0A2K8T9L9_9NOSO|nr:hypothetical protein COO91_10611 [Nostoc flagelliforme CCNUN1]
MNMVDGSTLLTIFEFKIQNSKFKMNNLNNFELINSGYKPPLIQRISGLQSVAGFKPPLIVILN